MNIFGLFRWGSKLPEPAPEQFIPTKSRWELLEEARPGFTRHFLEEATRCGYDWHEGPALAQGKRKRFERNIRDSGMDIVVNIAGMHTLYPTADTIAVWVPEGAIDFYRVQIYKSVRDI